MNQTIDTKNRILNAAERLFARSGYAATSLRGIIAEARVNLAAVHYHYHSKESLLEAVVMRRIGPLNQQRLALLEQYERAAQDAPLPLEKVLEAFLAPTLHLARDPLHADFVKLIGRIMAEGDLFPKIVQNHFGHLVRFERALARALPDLPPNELHWRMFFAVGVMAHTLRGGDEMVRLTGASFDSPEQILARLLAFMSAGFRAPASRQLVGVER